MRYHYPSTFNLKIKEIGNEENEFIYEIIIEKKKNIDLSNSQFFVNDGWKNDLKITCIPEEFKLEEDFIYNYLPKNYGKIKLSNITNNKKFNVGIIIPTFGRLEYIKKCFNSLKKCNLDNCIIVIVDESLTKDIDKDKLETNKFIKNFDFKIPTIKIYKNTHKNMFDSINVGLDILGNISDYLMNLDSDTIHNENFILKTIETFENIKKNNKNKLIVLSGFNTKKHKIIENNNLNYYLKETIGGCHLCFNKEDYWNYIRYTLISYKWNTNIHRLVNKNNGIIAVTKPSVIEHIGEKSSVRNDLLPYDKSIDFKNKINDKKFYIISEDLKLENNQTWIIDIFKKEFIEYSKLSFVEKPEDADIIWIIGTNINKTRYLKTINLDNKKIITTIHHIDFNKIDIFNKNFDEIKDITNTFHVICEKVYNDLKKLTNKPIKISNFWINEKNFYNISNKQFLREKYNIPENSYCIGSFQRDTEGKNKCLKPKLSKGPDIFLKIIKNINKEKKNLLVILTGRRRNYIINELNKNNIKYNYYEMVNVNELNELYNCLDLYIVSSRVEGGPRSIIECGLSKTPIISTDVGIAKLILDNKSIYDMNNYLTFKNSLPNINVAYNNSKKYSIIDYIDKFINIVFN